jgi:hypothetical protein
LLTDWENLTAIDLTGTGPPTDGGSPFGFDVGLGTTKFIDQPVVTAFPATVTFHDNTADTGGVAAPGGPMTCTLARLKHTRSSTLPIRSPLRF